MKSEERLLSGWGATQCGYLKAGKVFRSERSLMLLFCFEFGFFYFKVFRRNSLKHQMPRHEEIFFFLLEQVKSTFIVERQRPFSCKTSYTYTDN